MKKNTSNSLDASKPLRNITTDLGNAILTPLHYSITPRWLRHSAIGTSLSVPLLLRLRPEKEMMF